MNVMVTGGAGYIGSHLVKALLRAGHHVVTYDDLSTGHRDAVVGGHLVEGDVRDTGRLAQTLREFDVEAVVHLAGRSGVGESIEHPDLYYSINVAGSGSVLDAMRTTGVHRLVFSSTVAVYGEPDPVPVTDDHPARPLHPYGITKWIAERMLADHAAAFGTRSVTLRYCNAAGVDPEGELGERHAPETHLVPLACRAASGRCASITVFGRDYPTPDGTCLRDYIHVEDLCSAHLRALEYLEAGGESAAFNLGYGRGVSVREVLDTVERLAGVRLEVEEGPRRRGDPARLVAEATRAREALGWRPRHDDLEKIVADAWRRERRDANLAAA